MRFLGYMHWRCVLMPLLVLLALGLPATAEITEQDLEPVGAPNALYTDAIWGRNIQSEISYIRPSVDFQADQKVRITVPDKAEEDSEEVDLRLILGLILAAVLGVVIYVFVVNANGVGASFRKTTDDRRAGDARAASPETADPSTQPLDQFLAMLAAMADKREALILLVSRALQRAADLNGIGLGRAQTARDVLRVLPREWPHMPALRRLVREAEVVHFGGRDLTSDQWEDCFSAAEAIFRTPTS